MEHVCAKCGKRLNLVGHWGSKRVPLLCQCHISDCCTCHTNDCEITLMPDWWLQYPEYRRTITE